MTTTPAPDAYERECYKLTDLLIQEQDAQARYIFIFQTIKAFLERRDRQRDAALLAPWAQAVKEMLGDECVEECDVLDHVRDARRLLATAPEATTLLTRLTRLEAVERAAKKLVELNDALMEARGLKHGYSVDDIHGNIAEIRAALRGGQP